MSNNIDEDELLRRIEAQISQNIKADAKKNALDQKIATINRSGKKIILAVDDELIMLNLIKAHLQDSYEVIVVPNGTLALKYLNTKHADLVLLDYMMPGQDGPTVLKQIRESTPNPDIPVLFLTGVAEKDLVLKGLEFKPSGYLLKPFTKEILLERVTSIFL